MTRYHMINGKNVPFTKEEEAERDVEEAKWKEHMETVVIPNRYKTDRVRGKYTVDKDGNKVDPNEKLVKYPSIEELVVALYDTQDRAEIDKRRADVKKKYPKG